MNASVDFAAEGCYDYRSERTVSASVSYESHAGEGDKTVLYTIPMVYYEYEIENEETGGKGVMAAPCRSARRPRSLMSRPMTALPNSTI